MRKMVTKLIANTVVVVFLGFMMISSGVGVGLADSLPPNDVLREVVNALRQDDVKK